MDEIIDVSCRHLKHLGGLHQGWPLSAHSFFSNATWNNLALATLLHTKKNGGSSFFHYINKEYCSLVKKSSIISCNCLEVSAECDESIAMPSIYSSRQEITEYYNIMGNFVSKRVARRNLYVTHLEGRKPILEGILKLTEIFVNEFTRRDRLAPLADCVVNNF